MAVTEVFAEANGSVIQRFQAYLGFYPSMWKLSTFHIVESLIVGIVLTGLSYLVGLLLQWTTTLNWLEVAAVFTSYVCTYLCVKQRRINYPIGAVSTALYSILFFQSHLLASMALNLFLTGWLVYGWIRWRSDADPRPVTHLTWRMVPVYLGIGLAGWGVGYYIVTGLGGSLAIFDVLILVGTIIAQTLMDNKKLENWVVWAMVNVVAIYVYFSSGLALAGFQYVFFLLNAFYGWFEWRQSMKRTQAKNRHTHPAFAQFDKAMDSLGTVAQDTGNRMTGFAEAYASEDSPAPHLDAENEVTK